MKRVLFLVLIMSVARIEAHEVTYTDDFSGGVVNQTFWRVGSGGGVSQAGGVLNFSRNDSEDYIVSRQAFTGPFDLSFDMRMNQTSFNDMFHGVALMEGPHTVIRDDRTYQDGIGFGFSIYGTFFSIQHTTEGGQYHYDGGYSQGQWYRLRLVGDGTTVTLSVNDTLAFTRDFSYVEQFYVHLPGTYFYGGEPGPAQSSLDNFVLHATPVPEPASLLLASAGLGFAGFCRRAARKAKG